MFSWRNLYFLSCISGMIIINDFHMEEMRICMHWNAFILYC